jgi:hypothetical protein
MDSGERLRPGVVAYQTLADVHRHRLDLRRSNLLITTWGGVTLWRPSPQRYRGVHAVGRTGRCRATLSIGGHYRSLGLYDTEEEAARVVKLRYAGSCGCIMLSMTLRLSYCVPFVYSVWCSEGCRMRPGG